MTEDAGSQDDTRRGPTPGGRAARMRLLVVLPVLGLGLLYLSWPALYAMVGQWRRDQHYSHGFLVPIFAGYLLFTRRDMLARGNVDASWWGLPLMALGEGLRLAGSYYYVDWLQGFALLPSLAGLALLIGGRTALRWAAPAIGFLIFMIPLPYRVERAMGYPLQRIATLSSNYALQTMGLPSVAEGNVIHIEEARIGVVEACNGLGMLFTFLAIGVAFILVAKRPLLDKVLILLSVAPIALVANITRITATGLLHVTAGGPVADVVYHDLAGWLMMPLALGALWFELFLLSRLLIDPPPDSAAPIGLVLDRPLGPPPGGPKYPSAR